MNFEQKIILGDCIEELKNINDESIDLIITSPPYNIGKEYESRKSIEEYLNFQKSIIPDLVRVLKPSGSICWQVGNYIDKGEVFPLDIYYYSIFKDMGMKLRNRIVWTFGHGLHSRNRFSGRYETILWFTKSDDYTFNLDSVRVPSKYPGKKHYKGPKKGQLSGNPLGKNPSDIWEITNVKHNHPEKTEHPCQFPELLVKRLVLALSNEGDNVLDPFAGSGTVSKVCKYNNRNSVSIEKEEGYIEIIKNRINP